LNPTINPILKFKDNLPKFSNNGTIFINEHLVAFSNACHNIGANDNDMCTILFVNSLEGKFVVDFFELPPKVFLTWDELDYWSKSTYGQPQSPADLLKDYNKCETIKSFSLYIIRSRK
jgi:hypothetical protein